MTKEEIHRICRIFEIENYTINPDGSIDVDGNVELGVYKLDKIPLNFNIVSGYFNISNNNLSSLKGCPKYVGASFHCNYNKISTFEHFPNKINGSIYMYENPLESLKGYNLPYEQLNCDNKLKIIRKDKLKILDEL